MSVRAFHGIQCPLCGFHCQDGRLAVNGRAFYVIDCHNCRQLRIPVRFLTDLLLAKLDQRRAVGRILASSEPKYGPSLLLDVSMFKALLRDAEPPVFKT